MNDTDKPKFAVLMFGCGEYYGKTLSKGVVELYWQSLKTHSIDEVQSAVAQHMNDPDSGQFMPKVADIKRHLTGGKHTQAMQAWSKVERALRRTGPWESVCFDDPIIHRVLQDMGGWIQICKTPTDKDLEFRMHEFNKRYQGYVLQGGVSEFPRYMVGMAEASNTEHGYEVSPPLLLGDPGKAQAVYDSGVERKRMEAPRAQLGNEKKARDEKTPALRMVSSAVASVSTQRLRDDDQGAQHD